MPKYMIEREIIGAAEFTAEQLQAISQKSCCVLAEMGGKIQWLQSYVCADKVYCVYVAPDEATIYEHAMKGEFPVSRIFPIKTIIDPSTAELF